MLNNFFQNLRTELKIRFCSKVINVQKNVFWVKIDIFFDVVIKNNGFINIFMTTLCSLHSKSMGAKFHVKIIIFLGIMEPKKPILNRVSPIHMYGFLFRKTLKTIRKILRNLSFQRKNFLQKCVHLQLYSSGVDTDHEKDFTSFALRILNSIEEIEPKILIANLITTLTSCFYSTHPQMLPSGQNRRKHSL